MRCVLTDVRCPLLLGRKFPSLWPTGEVTATPPTREHLHQAGDPMSSPPTLVILLLLFIAPVLAISIAPGPQNLGFPGGIPLAVRSPYLNSWLPISTGFAADEAYSSSYDLSQVCTSLRSVAILSSSSILGPRMVRACACRQYHLYGLRNIWTTFYDCEFHQHRCHTYTNRDHHTSGTHPT